MKILQLVHKPERRGAEIFAYQLSDELISRGNDVKTVYLYSNQGEITVPLRKGDEILGSNEHHFSEKIPGFNLGIVRAIRKILFEFQPHVVQANGGRTVKYAGLLGRIDSRRKWVLVYRNIGEINFWLQGTLRKFLYRSLVGPSLDGIIAITDSSSHTIRTLYHGSTNIVVIPTGVNADELLPEKGRSVVRREFLSTSDVPVLIYVGSFTPEKRLDRLLRVFKSVHDQIPQITLWLIGDGAIREQIERQATELNLCANIRFFGYQTQVSTFLNAADLLVLLSDSEGLPGVILEAAVFGVPAVATRVGGLPDCIIHGQTGFLVDRDDESKMVKVIVDLLKSPAEIAAMGKRAKEWITQHFLIKGITEQYLNFYQQLLDQKAAAF